MTTAQIDSLMQELGSASVLTQGAAAFEALAARFSVHPGVELDFIAAAQPSDAEQVRQAVAFANSAGLAILTVFGASKVGARMHGSGPALILDLSHMNRILETDVANGFVRLEPGVTYRMLAEHFGSEGLPLWVDRELDPDASVIGSTVGKGIGFTPYGDHALVQCGAEFALPYGELMRTGMGAMPGSKTWQLYKYSLGPYADGLALESGLMVPTQMGVWVMGAVPAQETIAFDIENDAALAKLIESLRGLKIANMLPGTISITSAALDTARFPAEAAPAWRLVTQLYGLPRVVELTKGAALASAADLVGVDVTADTAHAASSSLRERIDMMSGKPGHGALAFPEMAESEIASVAFVAPIEDSFASAMITKTSDVMEAHGLPVLTEFAIVGRSLLQHVHLPYSSGNRSSQDRMVEVARQLASALQDNGIGLASTSFEMAHLDLKGATDSGLDVLHERIEQALVS